MEISPDVGLVLEGGGFRGIFTAAVLDVLHEENLFFHYAIGVSAGAAYAVSYVSRQYQRNLKVNAFVGDKRYCSVGNLIKTGNYFNWEFIYKEIPGNIVPFDYNGFNSSATRLRVVVTNCITGNAEYIDLNGSSPERFRDLLTATSSLPYISKIGKFNGKYYLDGGIADAIPVHQAFRDGNRRLIVVLTRDAAYKKPRTKGLIFMKLFYWRYPKIVKRFLERADTYNNTLEYLDRLEKEGKVFIIRPEKPIAVSRMENNPERLKGVYDLSVKEMRSVIPGLRKWLNC